MFGAAIDRARNTTGKKIFAINIIAAYAVFTGTGDMKCLTPQRCWHEQPLHYVSIFQMRLHDFVNVGVIDKCVPHSFRVNHRHRPGSAPIQTTGFVNPNFAGARQSSVLDLDFAVVKPRLRLVLHATIFAIFPLIEAKEDMPRVIRNPKLAIQADASFGVTIIFSHA